MTNQNRYELKTGKFGYYFFDTIIDLDMSLLMTLAKLNNSEILLNDRLREIIKLKSEKIQLHNKIVLLNERYGVK